MDQKLCFVRTRFEKIPLGVAYQKGLVQPRSMGNEVASVRRGGRVKVGAEQ